MTFNSNFILSQHLKWSNYKVLYSQSSPLIISLVKKKLAQNSALSSYIGITFLFCKLYFWHETGLLTNIYLSEGEYDVYGYCSATKTRIIVILTQKLNTEIYNENTLKQVIIIFWTELINWKFFKTIHEVYLQDLFNPFHDIRNGLSEYFQPKLNKAIELYEKAL